MLFGASDRSYPRLPVAMLKLLGFRYPILMVAVTRYCPFERRSIDESVEVISTEFQLPAKPTFTVFAV